MLGSVLVEKYAGCGGRHAEGSKLHPQERREMRDHQPPLQSLCCSTCVDSAGMCMCAFARAGGSERVCVKEDRNDSVQLAW